MLFKNIAILLCYVYMKKIFWHAGMLWIAGCPDGFSQHAFLAILTHIPLHSTECCICCKRTQTDDLKDVARSYFFTYNFMPRIVMDIWGQSSRLNVVMQRYVPAIRILDAVLLCTGSIHFGTLGRCNCTLHCKVPVWNHIKSVIWYIIKQISS